MNRRAFTLIEVMLAVLLLALLTAGVSLSLSVPLRTARAQDATAVLKAFDAAARHAATASNAPVRVTLDLADGGLERFENGASRPAAKMALPTGYRIDRVRVGPHTETIGLVPLDISAGGRSRTYAVRLVGPGLDRWVAFAGLTGMTTEASNEQSLPQPPRVAGHDAD